MRSRLFKSSTYVLLFVVGLVLMYQKVPWLAATALVVGCTALAYINERKNIIKGE